MKILGIMLKMRRILLFRTQLHFSSVFFHLNRQFTALEAVGLFQPSKRLRLLKILYCDKICANQELGMWETYFLPPLPGKPWKTSLPGLPQWLWQSPHTLPMWGQHFWDALHRAALWGEGWGTREGLGSAAGSRQGGRLEGRMAAKSGLQGMTELT